MKKIIVIEVTIKGKKVSVREVKEKEVKSGK
jgi:hypothetical protein